MKQFLKQGDVRKGLVDFISKYIFISFQQLRPFKVDYGKVSFVVLQES